MSARTLGTLVVVAMLSPSFALAAATPQATPTPARVAVPGGGLDRTFGDAGKAAPPAGINPVWEAVTVQADGKIVVVSSHGFASAGIVARYDSSGILDQTFGDAGIVRSDTFLSAVAITGDGSILGAGSARHDAADTSDAVVIKLRRDGTPDRGFGRAGVARIDLDENDVATAVIARPDRIVVLAGTSGRIADPPRGSAAVIGLRTDGELDTSFGDRGVTRLAASAGDFVEANAIVEEPNRDLVVAATNLSSVEENRRVRVIRVDSDGRLVRNFEVLPGVAGGIGRLADGKIVIDGVVSTPDLAVSGSLARFDVDGTLDLAFGNNGILASNALAFGKIVVDAQNRILTVGGALARSFSDGVLDTAFGVDGVAVDSDSAFARYHDVAVQRDGKIIAVGGDCFSNPHGGSGCFASLARYESDHTQLCGDADASGTFSVTDGVAILRSAAGFDDGCDRRVCNVDGSGEVTATDAVNVLRAAAGLSATLHCGIL